MAAELARHCVRPRIVERAAARTDKSKALVVWSRTLELLEVMGAAGPFLAAGLRVRGARIMAGRRQLAAMDLGRIDSHYDFALFIPQSETERLLEAHLATLGVGVERGVELEALDADEGGVTVRLRHRNDDHEESLRVPWLIGCDGAHSTIRHALGMPFEGETEPTDFLLADIRLDGPLPADQLTLMLHADGVLAIFPITPGRFRVVADLGAGHGRGDPASPTLGQIQALLDARGPGGLSAHDPLWLSWFRINERKVKDYRQGRVFLAGDAAHIHSPAGGQGMNTGIQDAVNLAWKLALVCRGEAQDGILLDSYSVERSAVGARVLRNATAMTRVAILRNPVLRGLRNLAVRGLSRLGAVQHGFAAAMSETDIHYPSSPLNHVSPGLGGDGRLKPGDRMPDCPLDAAAGGTTLHELLRSGRFVLVSAGAAAAGRGSDLVIPASIRPGSTPFAVAGTAYLVRPDAYVGMVGEAADAPAIGAYLSRITGIERAQSLKA
jgi:2-polyprenyl-6-methoxyphenol hydroxylase-like FAD-dependent oxidoreductase